MISNDNEFINTNNSLTDALSLDTPLFLGSSCSIGLENTKGFSCKSEFVSIFESNDEVGN